MFHSPLIKLTLMAICVISASSAPAVWTPKTALDKEMPFRRVIWVTRWDFSSPEDISKIMYNAASARFTDVLFQVRGSGTVFYRSKIEPWCYELNSQSKDPADLARAVGKDPGWDPLAVAIREGHRWGLRVHAYMNTMPGWTKLPIAPAATGQLYTTHRDWFMVDKQGRTMNNRDWYAFLDPSLPEVRRHLAALYVEVANNYNIDGIHLDYIRYPSEEGDYSYHPRALAAFRAKYGANPSEKPEAWNQFRRNQISGVVGAIARAVRAVKPGMEITAAVHRDKNMRDNQFFQDAHRWIDAGWVDAVAPMNYTEDMKLYNATLDDFSGDFWRGHVWPGLWTKADRNPIPEKQVARSVQCGFDTVAVYAYEYLFPNHKQGAIAKKIYGAFKAAGRQ